MTDRSRPPPRPSLLHAAREVVVYEPSYAEDQGDGYLRACDRRSGRGFRWSQDARTMRSGWR